MDIFKHAKMLVGVTVMLIA